MARERRDALRLSDLIGAVEIKGRSNWRDVEVSGVSSDSRNIEPGTLFVAVRGHRMDGHDFVEEAIRRGATALVLERMQESPLPTVLVEDSTVAVALLAKRFFADPAAKLVLIGITGTNGKTSVSFLLQSILSTAIGPTGIIGTVGIGAAGSLAAATHTTPASVDLYGIISDFLARGCKGVVMEVSSHAAVQRRITGLEFDVGVFTNISRDHLDYHETIDRYIAAKEMFIDTLTERNRRKKSGTFVYNIDDQSIRNIAGRFRGDTITFGFDERAIVRGENLAADLNGTSFDLVCGGERTKIGLKLLGSFSAYNALAAAAAARALGIGLPDIKRGLEEVAGVPGRFQVVASGKGPTVIVDFAHTPDALERLLTFCRDLCPARITTVFGCGGDRDRGKRPIMGKIASRISDEVYVTDDNPRTEDPDKIIEEILAGMDSMPHVERDRRSAIRKAVNGAREGELVVIAGKGHEVYQIFGMEKVPFSDAEEAVQAMGLREVGYQH
jgi:UDP-N-acetylmuramoyl-L-alanyl-D-glutamate--2,6-diaminopimelate ligase